MKTKKRIVILGATGSVGKTVIEELLSYREDFDVVGISCNRNIESAEQVARQLSVGAIAITDNKMKSNFLGKIFYGVDGLTEMVTTLDFDVLLVAISGINGLKPTLRAIERGKTIILASKEVLVAGGRMVMDLARAKQVPILPLDSEHNAIFQCTRGENRFIKKLQLTASGGNFWNASPREMERARVEDVLVHPKWSMGKKITVDSSTMANKGLEIIEAMHLFGVKAEQIDILIHPDCVVHSLVGFTDGSFLAQMSPVSMRYAVRFCLFFPERCDVDLANEYSLDLSKIGQLHFSKPDLEKFPCLQLALDVAKSKHSQHIAYNAANEVAVELFLSKKIAFVNIAKIIEETLGKIENREYKTLEEILAVDQMARSKAKQLAEKFYP